MKYCSKCGTPAEDNQNFCLNCGSRLTAPIAQAAAETAQNAAAAAATVQGQFAAQQQQTAAAAQTVQEQLAAQQTAAAEAAATAQAQQQAAAEAAAQVAATAEAQQAEAEAAAKAKSEAEASAKAEAAAKVAAQAEALRQAAANPSGAEAAIAQSQATAQAAVAQAQAATQQAAAQQVAPAVQAAAPVAQAAAPAAQAAAGGEKKKSGAGKWFAIIGFALVASVLVIILLVNLLGSSYRTPVKKLVKALNAQSTDAEDYLALYPKAVLTLYKDSRKTAKEGYTLIGQTDTAALFDKDAVGATMNEIFDGFEKKVGKNLKFSYTINGDPTQLSVTELASIAQSYASFAGNIKNQANNLKDKLQPIITNTGAKIKDANEYSEKVEAVINKAYKAILEINAANITDGYKVPVRLTYSGSNDEDYSDFTMRVIKVNGKWVLDLTANEAVLPVNSSYVLDMVKSMKLGAK